MASASRCGDGERHAGCAGVTLAHAPGVRTHKERAQRRIAALERNWVIKAVAILAALAGAMISFLQLLRLLRQ